jgi:hypothetical protein
LAGHDETELVQPAEGRQISADEPSISSRADGSVSHVEVFRIRCVGTLIIGRPRPLPRDRRAEIYTVNWEEPVCLDLDVVADVMQAAALSRFVTLNCASGSP